MYLSVAHSSPSTPGEIYVHPELCRSVIVRRRGSLEYDTLTRTRIILPFSQDRSWPINSALFMYLSVAHSSPSTTGEIYVHPELYRFSPYAGHGQSPERRRNGGK